jgi:hypothetical protein
MEHPRALMMPDEFGSIASYDETDCGELIHGVSVANLSCSTEEAGQNELPGGLLLDFSERITGCAILRGTLPQQFVRAVIGRSIAHRLV